MTFAESLAFAIIWAMPLAGLVLLLKLVFMCIYAAGLWFGWWQPGPPTESSGPH